jgi:transposase
MKKAFPMRDRSSVSSTMEATEGERSEPQGAGRVLAAPEPEVPEKAMRRRFSAEYKLRILRLADNCTDPGSLGRLLRKEGLYSSNLGMCQRL